ncbi:MipA/OmpV family protein [Paucibacter sp. R3-3]|uniref:MipA/OmpV family protein n=1 Tax=Roseateles agri TaxID=3098619 RepID=A0ABU5DJ95_9BURK|nr:MipA/OmpV family protein [Paucibacter sp. R3-3]MDY0745818.1 MipA/OmpV family protein [Paucibacter sp. R3-3]
MCLTLGAWSGSPAQAAGTLLLIDAPPAQPTLSAGVTTRAWPAAPGARQQDHALLPAFDYATPSGFFASTDDSIGWNLAPLLMDEQGVKDWPDWQMGARLWPQWGRPQRLAPAGAQRTGTRVTGELFANVQALPFLLLQSGMSFGSGQHRDGAQLELGATSGIPLGDELIGIGLAASYANAAHLRGSFGVGPVAGGPPAWQPSRGWQDWSLAISMDHKLSADWSISGQWLGARLLGAAARAPLTQTRFQPSYTVSLWRKF